MPVIGIAQAMLSTAGFVCAIFADVGLVSDVFASVRIGRSVSFADARYVRNFNHITSILIIACCAAHVSALHICKIPTSSEDFCRWIVRLFPLYFQAAFVLSAGYYGLIHFTNLGINNRRRLVRC